MWIKIERGTQHMVYVYSTESCGPCKMIKAEIERKGLVEGKDWAVKDIEKNEMYKKELMDMGYTSVPVVTKGAEFLFQGFRPDILAKVL